MPPEQRQGFSNIVDDRLGFGAHLFLKHDAWMERPSGGMPAGLD
jgi:hypothetical protein